MLLALAVVLLVAEPQAQDGDAQTLNRLDAEPLEFTQEVPPSAADGGLWDGYRNRFTLRLTNLAAGVSAGQSLPRIVVSSGLCASDGPCLLAMAYEFSRREDPVRKRVVFRIVLRNAAGKRWEGLANHENPGDKFRYWSKGGGPWVPQPDTTETRALHGKFYDEVLALIRSHPVRTPQPKHTPAPKKPSAPAIKAGAFLW